MGGAGSVTISCSCLNMSSTVNSGVSSSVFQHWIRSSMVMWLVSLGLCPVISVKLITALSRIPALSSISCMSSLVIIFSVFRGSGVVS